MVTEQIDNLGASGYVSLNGQEWMARSSDDGIIDKGKTVVIDRISGAKLIVSLSEQTGEKEENNG